MPTAETTAEVGAGVAAVGTAAAATNAAQATAGAAAGAVKALTLTIMGGLVAFLAALRRRHQDWLTRELGRYSTSQDDITRAIAFEMELEDEFARNSADRVARALPAALAVADPTERAAAVQRIMAAEQRYAVQRSEAMAARVIAAVTRMQLRRESPMGAYWKLGHAHKHTEGCLVMAGRFWPWEVLDRVHPPRHYGCTGSLHSYGEAILEGWMSPGDVPDTRSAIRAAQGVLMEGVADALLRELDVRDALIEAGVDAGALGLIDLKGVRDGAPTAI